MSEEDTSVVGNVLSCNVTDLSKWFKRNYIYVDKSLFIKEFMSTGENILFTRPRRFGKTLNMMLLQKFLSIFEEEPDERFKALKIFQDADFVNAHHRKYPVFFISFLSATSKNWSLMSNKIKSSILESMNPLKSYLRTVKMDDDYAKRESYQEMVVLLEEMNNKLNHVGEITTYFENMMYLVNDYFGIEPIVLIDEYDAPIRGANEGGFLDDALDILKPFYSKLSKGSSVRLCFTGILRVAANTVLSDLNNLAIYDINASDWAADRFSSMFGFTKEEVEELVQKCHENGLSIPTMKELESNYDGYVFGESTHIFNPYSVMCALFNRRIGNYWTATASGGNILSFIRNYESKIDLTELLKFTSQDPGSIEAYIDNTPDIVYGKTPSVATFHTILYHCGYLTKAVKEGQDNQPDVESLGYTLTTLKIPNLEVQKNLKSDIFKCFFSPGDAQMLTDLLKEGLEERDFRKAFRFIVANTIFALDSRSFPWDEKERNYHIAFTLFFTYIYQINDSRKGYRHFYEVNTGPGFADLIVEIPIADGEVLGIIFEFKYAYTEAEMEKRALEGLHQIIEKGYPNHFLQAKTASKVLYVGLSCHKMKVAFCYQLATRTLPSGSFVVDAPEAKCCSFPPKPEPPTVVQ